MTDKVATQRDRFEAWYYEQEVSSARAERMAMSYADAQAAFDAGWSAALAAQPAPVPAQTAPAEPDADLPGMWEPADLSGGFADVSSAQPAPVPVPLTDEQDRSLCEAHCNDATDEYFNARPQLGSAANRRIFYAGHRKGWLAHGIAASPEKKP
jgi:hypothetical protein